MRTLVIIITSIILFSCGNNGNGKNSRYENYLETYSEYLKQYNSYFPDTLVSHFPVKTDSIYTILPTGTKNPDTTLVYKVNRLVACFLVRKDSIIELENKYSTTAIQIIDPNDSCALIIHRLNREMHELKEEFNRMIEISESKDYTREYIRDSKRALEQMEIKCVNFTLPIPNFSSIEFDNHHLANGNRLLEGFKLYILNAEKGRFLDDEYLFKDIGLPSEWENGYSTGVAINNKRNIVLYWTEIW